MIKKTLILLIKTYRSFISPLLGENCRFYPSCSAYLLESIEKKGVLKGVSSGLKRISKCNSFNQGGVDMP